MSLSVLLDKNKCFKLVCGAGNEDFKTVEKLVSVYAKAGVHYFDLSPVPEVLMAAKNGVARVIKENERKNFFFCVSVGVEGDPHVMKAIIDGEKCVGCSSCSYVCLQKAITKKRSRRYIVIESRCIGCGACQPVCKFGAISFIYKRKDIKKILPPLIKLGVDTVEVHAITENEDESYKIWKEVENVFPGILSLCLDRSQLSNKNLLNRIKRFIKGRKDFSTIVQADGAPMSGSDDSANTTLQTIATADIVKKANLPVWILMSGGTNSKTTELAKIFGVSVNGVSIGSYARKIISKELESETFFENKKIFNSALKKAKKLVDISLKYLG